MKPIATVQWIAGGVERSKDFYRSDELDKFTAILDFKKFPYVVFMRSLRENIYFRRNRRPYREIS